MTSSILSFLRASISVVGRTPMTGIWKTQNTLLPSEATHVCTRLFSPLMTEEMVIKSRVFRYQQYEYSALSLSAIASTEFCLRCAAAT